MVQWQSLPKYETLDLIPRIKKEEEAGRKRRRKKRRKRERRKRKHFFLSYFLPALFMWDSNPRFKREAGHRTKRPFHYRSVDPTPSFELFILCSPVLKQHLRTCAPLSHLPLKPSMA